MKLKQAGVLEDLAIWIDPLVVTAIAESNSPNGRFALVFIEDRDDPFLVAGEAEKIAIEVEAANEH